MAQESSERMLNRDGTFNVVRRGMPIWDFVHPYHRLLRISWLAFFSLVIGCYTGVNILFGVAYFLCGPSALDGADLTTGWTHFLSAFFFSVQTLGTIGYGKITPVGLASNILVAVEALVGLMGFALITGLLFARFSRPMARISFSESAVIAPYRDGTALMFRIANGRSNELTNVRATVTLVRFENQGGQRLRRFHQLELERDKVTFLPAQWVVVHPIGPGSPLAEATQTSLADSDAELLILLSAVDETFSQTVQTRSSYEHQEVVWGARFRDIYSSNSDGRVMIDVRRLGEWDPAPLPEVKTKL